MFRGGFLVCKNSIRLALVTMLVASIMAKQAMAEVIQIEFTQFDTFSIEVANIGVGDTVEWLPKTEGTMLSSLLAQTWLTFLQNQI